MKQEVVTNSILTTSSDNFSIEGLKVYFELKNGFQHAGYVHTVMV
jgi:hypothetical protein